MQNRQIAARPLPLEGAFNVRDLGVYRDCHGRKLREHRLLRGDSPEGLTDTDIAFLKAALLLPAAHKASRAAPGRFS